LYPTQDVYETSGDGATLDFVGPALGRIQVTSSKSGIAAYDALGSLMDHAAAADFSSKKREISMLDSSVVLTADPVRTKRTKHTDSSSSKAQQQTSAAIAPVPATAAQPGTLKPLLTTAVLLLTDIPLDVCANDITGSLFSGLSVSAMYACSSGAPIVYNTSLPDTVDVYVEFSFGGGAELGLLRDGEELTYRVQSEDAPSAVTPASSSSSSRPTVKMVRRSIQPYVEAVEPELALLAQNTGLRITALPGKSATTPTLGPASAIRKHLESAATALAELAGSTGAEECPLLSNPLQLEEHWRDVLAQMALPMGALDAYSSDKSSKVRITKDTRYLFTNPAVDDILLCHGDTSVSEAGSAKSRVECEAGAIKFLDDEGEGLYNWTEDLQRCCFEPFAAEAEAELKRLAKLCGMLEVAREEVHITGVTGVAGKPVPGDKGDPLLAGRKFLADCLQRRLVLYKVLFKVSWSLTTTYCVFK
jgi:hypothetical protein